MLRQTIVEELVEFQELEGSDGDFGAIQLIDQLQILTEPTFD